MSLREIPQPLAVTKGDLDRVMRQGLPPTQDAEGMLKLLQLTGDVPDGKTLGERLIYSTNLLDKCLPPTGNTLQALNQTIVLTEHLQKRLALHRDDDNQHAEAENLVAVAERQIIRENDICPIATDLYLGVGSVRPEMVNRTIYEDLAARQNGLGELINILEALLSERRDSGSDFTRARRRG